MVGSGPESEVGVATEVTLLLSDGSLEVATILLTEDFADPVWARWAGLHLSSPSVGDHEQWDGDFFEALRQVRRDLDRLGILVLVNGARLDAWPSGMQSQSCLARGVYLTAPDAQEGQVRLLDPADPSQVGTVEQQDEYRYR